MTKNTIHPETGKRPEHKTPLQQLIADKRSLRHRLREEELELNEEWQNVRDNAGRLLLTGITHLFFPRRKNVSSSQSRENKSGFWQNITDNLPYYLSITRQGLSVAWNVIRPIYMQWQKYRRQQE